MGNRPRANEWIDLAIARALRTGEMLAVMYIDLDGFKPVNDNYGHPAGNVVLKEVSGRLGNTIRQTDSAFRLGGDEFLILIEGLTNPLDAETVARKLMTTIGSPIALENAVVQVNASIGIADLSPPASLGRVALLACADDALYQAKQEGKNTFCVAKDSSTNIAGS
ncbi:MAG: GGDEF domain-containing protein [Herminiimonas sp.]|nr:GGDEF domain-containing protein [Herminiimonas sp.]